MSDKSSMQKGVISDITGIPVFEDKMIREGTYCCLDKDGMPIKQEDFDKTPIARILVHDIETFKITIKHNQERTNL